MNQLTNIPQTLSSREIADLTGKRHDHVLRDCDNLNEKYKKLSVPTSGEGYKNMEDYDRSTRKQYKYLKSDTLDKIDVFFGKTTSEFPLIKESYYTLPNTGNQQHRCYELTKMQTIDLMTGYNIELRIKINRRWEELENQNSFQIPQTMSEALMLAANQHKVIEDQQKILKKQEVQIAFVEKVLDSDEKIDIGQCAKILELPFGRNTLFKELRDRGIFFKNRNEPKQYFVDRGYFQLKERWIERNNHDSFIVIKVLVTQKGLGYLSTLFNSNPQTKRLAEIN